MRGLLVLASACLLCVIGEVLAQENARFPITPHDDTQALLAKWVDADTTAEMEDSYRVLGQLCSVAREDRSRFVEQGLYFISHMPPEEREKGLGIYHLFVLCTVQEQDIAVATSRFLYGEHQQLRELARDLFRFAFRPKRDCYPDFSHFRNFITGDYQKTAISRPLRRMMFEMSPNAAFLEFHTEAQEEMLKLRRAERVISNARFERDMVRQERDLATFVKSRGQEIPMPPPWKPDANTAKTLRALATSKHWWARMFAAETMVQVADFRDAELLKKLADDENELVRQSVASIDNPDSLRYGKVDR